VLGGGGWCVFALWGFGPCFVVPRMLVSAVSCSKDRGIPVRLRMFASALDLGLASVSVGFWLRF
jgi:hypothetical protein